MLAPLVATAWPLTITLVVICESEIELKGLNGQAFVYFYFG